VAHQGADSQLDLVHGSLLFPSGRLKHSCRAWRKRERVFSIKLGSIREPNVSREDLRQSLESAAVCRTGACAVAKVCLVVSGRSRPRWKKAGNTIRLPSSERSEGTTACG